jgi:hypothetical protein
MTASQSTSGAMRCCAAIWKAATPISARIAEAIRPVLEALSGPFINICRQRIGTADQVLDYARTQELDNLLEYANKFHHDTNMAWETEVVNDGLLVEFVKRTLAFLRH